MKEQLYSPKEIQFIILSTCTFCQTSEKPLSQLMAQHVARFKTDPKWHPLLDEVLETCQRCQNTSRSWFDNTFGVLLPAEEILRDSRIIFGPPNTLDI